MTNTRRPIRRRLSARGSAVIAFAIVALAASAEELKPAATICAPYYDELQSKGKVLRTNDKGSPSLLPIDASADRIRAAIAADKPGILVETVFFLPRSAPAEPAARRGELARIYGLLRSFSTLEGIQYFSVSHNAMRTLYAESYRIDDPKTRLRLPDPPSPLPSEIPAEETLFAFQRDLSFGANVYSYVFTGNPGSVIAEISNLTRMSVGIIPLVAPKALKMRLFVMPASDGIVFYTESDSSSPGPFRSRLEGSFANRAAALFAWFSAKSAYFLPR